MGRNTPKRWHGKNARFPYWVEEHPISRCLYDAGYTRKQVCHVLGCDHKALRRIMKNPGKYMTLVHLMAFSILLNDTWAEVVECLTKTAGKYYCPSLDGHRGNIKNRIKKAMEEV